MADAIDPVVSAAALTDEWGSVFPVDVRALAFEHTQRFADPVFAVEAAPVGVGFEGALYRLPRRGGWAILFNPDIPSPGRINFTLAHELGHYVCHRNLRRTGFECSSEMMRGTERDSAFRRLEREADRFASHLLMPAADFRCQVDGQTVTLDLIIHCAERYRTSFTAAALKWLELTEERAALVCARDGFILWGRSSEVARRSGLSFAAGSELPSGSVAASRTATDVTSHGSDLPLGVWNSDEGVREMTIFADEYDVSYSLVVFDSNARSHKPVSL
jgi:IrrE N-terminal-like domain